MRMDSAIQNRQLRIERFLFICAVCSGCASPFSDVVYTESIDPNIRNGHVTEVAIVKIDPTWTLRIPASAQVQQGGAAGRIEIRQRKELNVAGHPPEIVSIDKTRHKMGTVARLNETVLELDTFGTYKIDGAGGANISLTCIVPNGTVVETGDSVGMKREEAKMLGRAQLCDGQNEIEPRGDWKILQNTK